MQNDILSASDKELTARLDVSLVFEGPFPLGSKKIPDESGIYVVYTANIAGDNYENLFPIYIGTSKNMRKRLGGHHKYWAFLRSAFKGKEIVCTGCRFTHPQMERIEAALIFCNKPKINKMYSVYFPFGPTKVKLAGAIQGLFTESGDKIFVRNGGDIGYWRIERSSSKFTD